MNTSRDVWDANLVGQRPSTGAEPRLRTKTPIHRGGSMPTCMAPPSSLANPLEGNPHVSDTDLGVLKIGRPPSATCWKGHAGTVRPRNTQTIFPLQLILSLNLSTKSLPGFFSHTSAPTHQHLTSGQPGQRLQPLHASEVVLQHFPLRLLEGARTFDSQRSAMTATTRENGSLFSLPEGSMVKTGGGRS